MGYQARRRAGVWYFPQLLAASCRSFFEEFDGSGDALPTFDLIPDLHYPTFPEIGLRCHTLRNSYHDAVAQLDQLAVHVGDSAFQLVLPLVNRGLRRDRPARAGAEDQSQRGQGHQYSPHLLSLLCHRRGRRTMSPFPWSWWASAARACLVAMCWAERLRARSPTA